MKHVSCGIIIRGEGKKREIFLVSSKKELGKYTGYYYPPGGHVEAGESREEALIREIKEELNLEVTNISYIASSPGDVKDQTTHWFHITVHDLSQLKLEDKLRDGGFFTLQELEKLPIWPATRLFLKENII